MSDGTINFFAKIGVLLVVTVLFAIPILMTCSFAFKWGIAVRYILTILAAAEYSLTVLVLIEDVN